MQMEELAAGRGALKAVRTGEGPDIVVLHSLLADRHAFDPVLPALAAKHRVTLINLPGFHGSQPPLLALMDAYVAIIEDGFQEFEISKDAVLIGNGFGGSVAVAFAIAHPERIARLVVSDAAAGFPPEGRQQFAAMAQKVAEAGLGAVAEISAKRVYSPAYLASHPEKIDERKKVLLGIDPKAFQAACRVLQETDLVPLLSHLRVPTLVVCGELDQATPPALNKEIADKVAGAKYVELPGCGHCPPLEQPEAFIAAIGEFVGL
ncbi:MAG TPA: alpha/beta fold hydrolase [Beijerinckiaceae bacterium]|jgi:pimeloyl-ACP methyl ester carboxylesterase|nr:alpha/beta fold hydrolase [Beijerinckiaceae bacterium]